MRDVLKHIGATILEKCAASTMTKDQRAHMNYTDGWVD